MRKLILSKIGNLRGYEARTGPQEKLLTPLMFRKTLCFAVKLIGYVEFSGGWQFFYATLRSVAVGGRALF